MAAGVPERRVGIFQDIQDGANSGDFDKPSTLERRL
jgi:hypothetical protein